MMPPLLPCAAMKSFRILPALLCALGAAAIGACTPAHDWREVHGTAASFTVLMPAKPTTLARRIDLNGTALTMTMTAAEIDTVTYAVGCVELPDGAAAKVALQSMQIAMVNNMHGRVLHQKAAESRGSAGDVVQTDSSIDLEAVGTPPNGGPRLLLARFVAHNRDACQAIVSGPQKSVAREQADTFLTSFKLP